MRQLQLALALMLATSLPPWCPAPANEIQAQIAGRVVFVPVRLNGRGPFQFIVDTGATETIVTPSTARAAGIATLPYPGLQKKGIVGSLSAGNVSLTNLPVFIFDPPQALSLRLDEGINYGGILGYTFLSRFATTIDYSRSVVQFEPPAQAAAMSPATNSFLVPFRLVDRLIHVSGKVNRSGPLTFLLDTGSAEVLLSPPIAEQLKLKSQPLPSYPGARLTTLDQLSMGEAVVSHVSTLIHRPPGERIAGATYDGIVGYPFLAGFVVTIRYDKALIRLTPESRQDGTGRDAPPERPLPEPGRRR
ncbi:MAG: aspartyl protease family protein [Kiritimatiellia bacterium]